MTSPPSGTPGTTETTVVEPAQGDKAPPGGRRAEDEDREREADRGRERERAETERRTESRSERSQAKPGPRDVENQSVEPKASTQGSREALVSLYVRGSSNDAKALYGSSPGATDFGWNALERMLTPVKQFIADGGMPYTVVQQSTEYAGLDTPAPEAAYSGEPGETRSVSEYAATRQPGNLSADVEAEMKDRGLPSFDQNPGATSGRSQTQPRPRDREVMESETPSSSRAGVSDEGRPGGRVPAADLIARAEAATTREELDEILALADDRVTVIDAVEAQAHELGI